ncbi:MAG: RagB/SusD family nutrient uptake outer membrane protein [Chitinophaga sp.]|uniref:RagB/SusD family nutrient uptake outer membrane protein n=1 Tax=Chitinophaga sp. TaxID=1869181 RepID=UPI001B23B7C9|nr:RagB/SusD family nutrient uptake outer membrane protein [Chitinophaga sp.]MBO9732140.1 RagB/SusD family nutrient uptake outer membrane protein [Chitinophaga sp.]
MTTLRLPIKVLLVAAMLTASCKNTLEVSPTHLVPEKNMWTTRNDARSAVFATYGLFRAALADNNAYLVYGELRAGDFKSAVRTDLSAVTTNQLNASSATLEGWKSWRRFYAAIAQANLCLEKLALVHEHDFRYTPEEMKLDIAQVRFLRALTYFYLVRIWGDVPLLTNTGDGNFTPVKREQQDKVLEQAMLDAQTALKDLPWSYYGTSPELLSNYWGQPGNIWQGVIGSKGAAYALLAHISAWKGDYLSAERYAHTAMDNKARGGYNLVDVSTLTGSADASTFSGQGANVIFALPFKNIYQESSGSGHIEDWTLADPYISRVTPDIYVPSDSILKIFNEPNDSRYKVGTDGIATGNYFAGFGNPVPMFTKIRMPGITGVDPLRLFQSAIVVFRYEELVLLRAEALLFLGKNEDATFQLNAVRAQRNLPDFKTGNLANAILAERRRELLGEGWRWYDLVRFEKLTTYTSFKPADIARGAQWWPVSKDVLSSGKEITQTKFWQQ